MDANESNVAETIDRMFTLMKPCRYCKHCGNRKRPFDAECIECGWCYDSYFEKANDNRLMEEDI